MNKRVRTIEKNDVSTAIFIPTFKRPHKVAQLTENIYEVTKSKFKIYFIVEKNDSETIAAVNKAGENLIINIGPPTYSSCINFAYTKTSEPFFFAGADDLRFRDRWLEEALTCMLSPEIGVVGTNDPRHPNPDHSTHYLVRRSYIKNYSGCIDIPNIVLYPYRHTWTDWEFIGTAKARKMYTYCEKSIVEHIHPGWKLGGTVNDQSPLFDETYAKGNKYNALDKREFIKRSNLWFKFIKNKTGADEHIEKFILLERSIPLLLLRRFIPIIEKFLINYFPMGLKLFKTISQIFEGYFWVIIKRISRTRVSRTRANSITFH